MRIWSIANILNNLGNIVGTSLLLVYYKYYSYLLLDAMNKGSHPFVLPTQLATVHFIIWGSIIFPCAGWSSCSAILLLLLNCLSCFWVACFLSTHSPPSPQMLFYITITLLHISNEIFFCDDIWIFFWFNQFIGYFIYWGFLHVKFTRSFLLRRNFLLYIFQFLIHSIYRTHNFCIYFLILFI